MNYFNIPCYAYGTTGETKQIDPAMLISDIKSIPILASKESISKSQNSEECKELTPKDTQRRGVASATGGTVANQT